MADGLIETHRKQNGVPLLPSEEVGGCFFKGFSKPIQVLTLLSHNRQNPSQLLNVAILIGVTSALRN